jgi:hypothetical protein
MEKGLDKQLFADSGISTDPLQAELERMRELICYLLSKNQQLRMKLTASGKTRPIKE